MEQSLPSTTSSTPTTDVKPQWPDAEKQHRKQRRRDRLIRGIVIGSAVLVIGTLLLILGYILLQGIPHLSWDLFTTPYKPGLEQYGIQSMIVSTLMLIILTLVIATPIGILSAIYLNEYAKKGKVLEVIRFATESLAGIPSILFGLFGYALFVLGFGFRYSILSGSLTLAIMVLPVIIRTTEQALQAVPMSYREGSLALGAGKLYTIWHVVLPNAIAGILTSVILSVGRIIGETAAVIYTMGTVTEMPTGFLSAGRSLSVHLYFLAKEGVSFDSAFAVAVILLVLVLILNTLASFVAKRIGRKGKGEA